MVMSRFLLMIAATAAVLSAQGRVGGGGFAPRPMPAPSRPPGAGFGNVVNPSGVGQNFSVVNPIYSQPSTFAGRLSATVSGNDWSPFSYQRQRWRGGIVPVPMFIGGGFYQNPSPNVTIINAPPAMPAVIINQSYVPDRVGTPVVTEVSADTPAPLTSYQAPVPQNPEGRSLRESGSSIDVKPTIYLIAMKEGQVYAAFAYWVEGDTLHYITTKHAHNRASLSLIDEEISRQLNSERGLEFKLPKP